MASSDDQLKKQVYSYMWKTYDLTTKSRTQFLKDHIYVTNPVKALGKFKTLILRKVENSWYFIWEMPIFS